jgi:hypothetical protein
VFSALHAEWFAVHGLITIHSLVGSFVAMVTVPIW